MKMIPGHLYSCDCQDGGNGIFYGVYTHSNDTSYWFDYIASTSVKWYLVNFCCQISDFDRLTHIGDPSDFPEYFV